MEIYLAPYFKDADVRAIGLAEVQRFYDHCIDTGRPRSARSTDMALNVLRLIALGRGAAAPDGPPAAPRRGRVRNCGTVDRESP